MYFEFLSAKTEVEEFMTPVLLLPTTRGWSSCPVYTSGLSCCLYIHSKCLTPYISIMNLIRNSLKVAASKSGKECNSECEPCATFTECRVTCSLNKLTK